MFYEEGNAFYIDNVFWVVTLSVKIMIVPWLFIRKLHRKSLGELKGMYDSEASNLRQKWTVLNCLIANIIFFTSSDFINPKQKTE